VLATLWVRRCPGVSRLFPRCFVARSRDGTRDEPNHVNVQMGRGSPIRYWTTVKYVTQNATASEPDTHDEREPLVSLGRRLSALVIDWMLCLFASGLLGGATRPWVAPTILVIEYGFFIGFFAQTPGMFVARIRCVEHRTGAPIGILRSLLRGLLLALLVPALIMDRAQRGLHDRAAGSVIAPAGSITAPADAASSSAAQP
jgi:uncharacterized RDD family membrane protein YckC